MTNQNNPPARDDQANPPRTQGNSAAYDHILEEVRSEEKPHFEAFQDAYRDLRTRIAETPITPLGTGTVHRRLLEGEAHTEVVHAYHAGCHEAQHVKSAIRRKLDQANLAPAPDDSKLGQMERGLDEFTGLSTVQTGSALPETTTRLYHNVERKFISLNLFDDEDEREHGETTPVAAIARQHGESHVSITIERGQGRRQFNNSKSMRALIKAYKERGKPQRLREDAWDKFKKKIKAKLQEDHANRLLGAIAYSKDTITMNELSPLKINFVGFDEE